MKNSRRGYDAIVRLPRKIASIGARQAIKDLRLNEKIDELLYHVDRIKNSTTVKTGEFEALTRLFTGQKMYLDTRDISLAPHIMLDGFWEPEITKLFREAITPNAVVLDIGANFGYYGLVAGTQIDPHKGQLHFFEANPRLKPYIYKSLAINNLIPCSTIVNKAVSSKPGNLSLTLLNDFWGSAGIDIDYSTAASFSDVPREYVEVPAITIDDYVRENNIKAVDVIKIDIEGHEETAYKGMRKTVKKSPKLKMFLEFSEGGYKNAQKFFELLKEDFGHIYAITNENGGSTKEVKSFAALKRLIHDDWIMLLASKNPVEAQA